MVRAAFAMPAGGDAIVQTGHAEVTLAHRVDTGRVRLSCPALRRRPELAGAVRAALATAPGVRRAEVRVWTGSIIIQGEPGRPTAEYLELAEDAVDAARHRGRSAEANRPAARAGPAMGSGYPWHSVSLASLSRRLETDLEGGLDEAFAEARLRRHGPNLMPHEEVPSGLVRLAKQFDSLPVGMLCVSAGLSVVTGRLVEATATLAVVGINAVLGYVTEGQAENAIAALTSASTQKVSVLRDGRVVRVRAADLVPGDVYIVGAGEQVAADARIAPGHTLRVDESAFTGESLPTRKSGGEAIDASAPIGSRCNMLYSGSIVAQGGCRAIVVATGRNTEAARVALLTQEAVRPQAPIEIELERMGRTLSGASLAACGLFFAVGVVRGTGLSQMLRSSLTLAVAAVPEGLPVVATTTMALALRRMEKRGVLIRHLRAVEGLGAIQTMCLDKTGTLTRNRMTVSAAIAGLGEVPTERKSALDAVLRAAVLNNDAVMDGAEVREASATERALVEFALHHGVDVEAARKRKPRIGTIERTDTRPWMATLHRGAGPKVIVKGAPGAVLRMCSHVRVGRRTRPLTEKDGQQILALNDAVASRPARVLGFAEGRTAPEDGRVEDLTWLGALGMVDPLRSGAKSFVESLVLAGIRPVIITGDQAATALSIARELGLGRDGSIKVMDATEISDIDRDLLAGLARDTQVFARVSASQKLAIVRALQDGGMVVGMTGDGVNDGPALKAAEVGLAMGASGTNLARDIANVVIRDDELETLGTAISEGRTAYRNIARSLGYLVTTNISEIIVEIVEALHGPEETETPMELLWINLVSDILPGLGLAMAAPERDIMKRPPRDRGEAIMGRHDLGRIAVDGATISVATLLSHALGMRRYGAGPKTRGMTFLSLSVGQLLYALVAQHRNVRDLRVDKLFSNPALDGAITASIGLAVLPFFSGRLGRLLSVSPLGVRDAAPALLAAVAPVAAVLARRGIAEELDEIERHA